MRETGGEVNAWDFGLSTDEFQIKVVDDDLETHPDIWADLTEATAVTISELRTAFQIQKLQERDARGGTRYTEIIKSHFQVTSPDARLQRAEYLGGGSTGVHVQLVPQTSETDVSGPDSSPQANISGYGTANVNGHGFNKGFVEHGWIIGLINVRADLTYQQGIDKQWSRSTKHDFYWPAFQGLSEQAVLNKEIWFDGSAEDEEVWGYQERFAEMRYKKSQITGLFRSDAPESLDAWHLSQDFETRPVLTGGFIGEDPPIDRIIAVPDEPPLSPGLLFQIQLGKATTNIRSARIRRPLLKKK